MKKADMSSLERVFTAINQKEPDRLPFFILATLHGAKELGLSIREYFSKAEYVVEGQFRLRDKYRHDCLVGFFYAAAEVEAWGGEVIFVDDGPPNSGTPIIRSNEEILSIEPPRVGESACLVEVLKAIEMMKARIGDKAPVVGVVISPFSLPVMQLGFGQYLDIIIDRPDLFERLMGINETFCIEWANAQLAAGATAICYFDPVSSTTIIPREMYLKTGFKVANRTLAGINGPTATHMASGRCLPIVDDLARTGTAIIGTSAEEDLAELKKACRGNLTILGNLNGIEMCRWTKEEAEVAVKDAVAKAGPGGGFILSDNHGEIPWQVPDDILAAISGAVYKWGRYPLDWVNETI